MNGITEISGPSLDLLNSFVPISREDLTDMVSKMGTSSCFLDPVSSKFLTKLMDVMAPDLLSIINRSLISGCVPDLFKTACVQPLLKGLEKIVLT